MWARRREGFEYELFSTSNVAKLENTDLIIELHDFINPKIKDKIFKLFSDSHTILIINEKYAELPRLLNNDNKFMPVGIYTEFTDEERPVHMEWAIISSKK